MSILDFLGLFVLCSVVAWLYLKVWADVISPGPERER